MITSTLALLFLLQGAKGPGTKAPASQPTESQTQTFSGRLVDAVKTNCSSPVSIPGKAAEIQVCPVNVTTTSFGLLLSGGRFLKFDEGGNAKAIEALKKSRKGSQVAFEHWRTGKTQRETPATVTGMLTSDTLNVGAIRVE